MRGKGSIGHSFQFFFGITPAYAGKSLPCWEQHRLFGDHPRLCGEKKMRVLQMRVTLGSPPPMRGKVSLVFDCRSQRRITPAYAGKRSRYQRAAHLGRDHPRLCGEKTCENCKYYDLTGSPPPMRGKERKPVLLWEQFGITPAYAGKSACSVQSV